VRRVFASKVGSRMSGDKVTEGEHFGRGGLGGKLTRLYMNAAPSVAADPEYENCALSMSVQLNSTCAPS